MRFDEAYQFVIENGSPLEVARIEHILYRKLPPQDVLDHLHNQQNADGGFPLFRKKNNLSAVGASLYALWWMDDLGLLNSQLAERTIRYVLSQQQPDGAWDESQDLQVYDPPIWARPGVENTRIYLTGYALFWIAALQREAMAEFYMGIDFLRRYIKADGSFIGYPHSTWIATSTFILAEGVDSTEAHKGLKYLEDKPIEDWVDSQIGWALNCFSKAGLPQDHPLIATLLDELVRRQMPNGNWISEDSEDFLPSVTVDILKALKSFGRI